MVFLLVKKLFFFRNKFNDFIAFFETALNCKRFLLHDFDRFKN